MPAGKLGPFARITSRESIRNDHLLKFKFHILKVWWVLVPPPFHRSPLPWKLKVLVVVILRIKTYESDNDYDADYNEKPVVFSVGLSIPIPSPRLSLTPMNLTITIEFNAITIMIASEGNQFFILKQRITHIENDITSFGHISAQRSQSLHILFKLL